MPNIAGQYSVIGTLVNGQPYTGQVTIRGGADNVKVEWRSANGTSYVGYGNMKGDIVTIDWVTHLQPSIAGSPQPASCAAPGPTVKQPKF